tara:strand:+ start:80 stop:499 length:420 start_codon:yes stop_codon:yes gene_type:complete
MKISLILKIVGSLHFLLGLGLWTMLIFGTEIFMSSFGGVSLTLKTFKAVASTADVVGAHSIAIGLLLFFCSYIKEKESLKIILLGELAVMLCLLCIALYNTFSPYWAPELPGYTGPPPPFWLIIVLNPLLCIYGYIKGK